MNRLARFGLMGVLLIIGFGAGYITRSRQIQTQATTGDVWLFSGSVPLKGPDGAVSYNSNALLADIPLPEIEAIEAKVKLIPPPSGDGQRTRVLAYVARVRVASLEKKNVPPKYLKERIEQHKAGPITTLPLEQVTYAVQFAFHLLDKDGFKLAEVTGPDQWLQSGKSNAFQEVTSKPLDLDLARRIAKVRTYLHVLRCESCRSG